jgi:hypothetical protein
LIAQFFVKEGGKVSNFYYVQKYNLSVQNRASDLGMINVQEDTTILRNLGYSLPVETA